MSSICPRCGQFHCQCCPRCHQYHPGFYMCSPQLFGQQVQLQGCICPPTSEQTCMNPLCPRRNHLAASGITFQKDSLARTGGAS